MPIDFSKPVKTVSGLGVTILETACPGDKPVVGRFTDAQGTWIFRWHCTGRLGYTPSDFDLVQAPETITEKRYVNIYKSAGGRVYFGILHVDKDDTQTSNKDLFARKCIEFVAVEGEGL